MELPESPRHLRGCPRRPDTVPAEGSDTRQVPTKGVHKQTWWGKTHDAAVARTGGSSWQRFSDDTAS